MNGQWLEVEAPAPHQEGYAWAGLLVVHAFDWEGGGGSFPNHFEILHQASGELMLEVNATLERTLEIAADLANITDWDALSTTDEPILLARIMAFGIGHPGEVIVTSEWAPANDLDHIVPYRLH